MIWLFGSFTVDRVTAASVNEKHGDVPPNICATVFAQFARIQPPADTKAVSHALKDTRWLTHAVVYQQTALAGWLPMSHHMGPPGGIYVLDLSPDRPPRIPFYRIYLHTTRAFSGDPAIDVRAFLAGHGPRDIRIDEYTLCHPNHRFLTVDTKSRRLTPPL
jgi:hypothetical protein